MSDTFPPPSSLSNDDTSLLDALFEDDSKKNDKAISVPIQPQFAEQAKELLGLEPDKIQAFTADAFKALKKITATLAVFTLGSWEKKIDKLYEDQWGEYLKHPQWGAFRTLLCEQLGMVPLFKSDTNNPKSLYGIRYLIKLEQQMLEFAKRQTNEHVIPQELIDKAFASRPTMAEEQRNAAFASSSGTNAVVVTEGTAGAGKSFTLAAVNEIYSNCPPRPDHPDDGIGYDILGGALSWTAAKVLEESAGLAPGSSQAIKGLVMAMDKAEKEGQQFFKRRSLLIIDEAGLVDVYHMYKLLYHAANSEFPVRVLLTGDSLQLNPVQAGNALEAIVDACGSSRLDTIRRQKQESHRNAVKHFCFGRAEQGIWTFWQQEAIHFCKNADERRERVMQDYIRYCMDYPDKNALVLALENEEVRRLNKEIRLRLRQVGRLIGSDHLITITDGKTTFKTGFCVGDQVVLRKNNKKHPVYKSNYKNLHQGLVDANSKITDFQLNWRSLLQSWNKSNHEEQEIDRYGVFNRTNGVILSIKPHPEQPKERIIRILLASGGETDIDTSTYKDEETGAVPLNHNFATTIYASQGQTVPRVFMLDSPRMQRRLAYVGMSRHTHMCDLYVDCQEVSERMEKEALYNKDLPSYYAKAHELIPAFLNKINGKDMTPFSSNELTPQDFLRSMVKVWNQASENPTVGMKIKSITQAAQKKQKFQKKTYKPFQAPYDNPDDYSQLGEKFIEPTAYAELISQAQPQIPKETKRPSLFQRNTNTSVEANPQICNFDTYQEPINPTFLSEPMIEQSIQTLVDKKIIGQQRFGYWRIHAFDPYTDRILARYNFDGKLTAGLSEIPVLPNDQNPQQSQWFIVSNVREALIAYTYFRQKHSENPHKVPNIAVLLPQTNPQTLLQWIHKGSVVYCAWSKQKPQTLEQAHKNVATLQSIGLTAKFYPKLDNAPAITFNTLKP